MANFENPHRMTRSHIHLFRMRRNKSKFLLVSTVFSHISNPASLSHGNSILAERNTIRKWQTELIDTESRMAVARDLRGEGNGEMLIKEYKLPFVR